MFLHSKSNDRLEVRGHLNLQRYVCSQCLELEVDVVEGAVDPVDRTPSGLFMAQEQNQVIRSYAMTLIWKQTDCLIYGMKLNVRLIVGIF